MGRARYVVGGRRALGSRSAAWMLAGQLAWAPMWVGCGSRPSPGVEAQDPWVELSEDAMRSALDAAQAGARRRGRLVLIEFLAPWCPDCREVVRLAGLSPAKEVIERSFEVVYVNVGRFDRHAALRSAHQVDRIATWVVLDPRDGRRLARTTMEPISKGTGLSSEGLADWLRRASQSRE